MLFQWVALLWLINCSYAFKLNADIFNPLGLGLDGLFARDFLLGDGVDQDKRAEGSDSSQLYEFTPIKGTLTQSQKLYFQYNVNTSSGLGEAFAFLVLISGNICDQPTAAELAQNNASLTVYYSFNSSIYTNLATSQMAQFENGYFEAVVDVPVNDENGLSTLYIVVQAPENTNKTIEWSYQIGVSQNGLVYQWDDRTWSGLVDTDENSALIVTGNLSLYSQEMNYSSANALELSNYHLYIYPGDYKQYFELYNHSWCAVQNGPYLFLDHDFETSYTFRNGGLQQQFYVTGLNSSTKYLAYLLLDNEKGNYGGVLYEPFEFTTMDYNACELIYNLEFCDTVAYSVPALSKMSKDEISLKYDEQAKELYQNFLKALQQIACNTTDNAKFSPINSCENCAMSYKNWLCAVTIPRCLTHNVTGYKLRDVGESRNDFINTVIQPDQEYYEVMPCIDVCHNLVRDCPADLGFICPRKNSSIAQSYYWDLEDTEYALCNYLGSNLISSSGAIIVLSNWRLAVTMLLFCIFM